MAIQRKPKRDRKDIDLKAAERFVDGATPPDTPVNMEKGKAKVTKEKKVLISLRFQPTLLEAIDQMAERRGMSRNALISYWCSRGVEGE